MQKALCSTYKIRDSYSDPAPHFSACALGGGLAERGPHTVTVPSSLCRPHQSATVPQQPAPDWYGDERCSLFAVLATEGETSFLVPDTTLRAFVTPRGKPQPLLAESPCEPRPRPVPASVAHHLRSQAGLQAAGLLAPVQPVCGWRSPCLNLSLSVCQGHALAAGPQASLAREPGRWGREGAVTASALPSPGGQCTALRWTLCPRAWGRPCLLQILKQPHGVLSALARAVGTAPGGPGCANSLISLIGEQSSESGYKFSSRHFFGKSQGS